MRVTSFFLYAGFLIVLALTSNAQPTQSTIGPRLEEVESPKNTSINRSRGIGMLEDIKAVLKQHYYDKSFRGIDLDARFKTAKEHINTLSTNAQIFRAIAQVLLEFDDSHTRFIPPNRANWVEYGFTMQMVGNDCFVISVEQGSAAESKGLKAGDKIQAVGNFEINRENLWIIKYLIYSLDPQPKLTLNLQGLDNTERKLTFAAKFKTIEDRRKEAEKNKKEKRENPYKCQSLSESVLACRLESFAIDKKFVDKMMAESKPFKKLILDLRGNAGGYMKTEEYLIGHFFDREIKIGDFIVRGKAKPRVAKPQKERMYKGDLVVLVDSESASAAEVFARVIQIEKRGKIVGDVSAGAVMTSYFIPMTNVRGAIGGTFSDATFSAFAVSVTVADLVMSDGKRIEKIGVRPDHPVGPTAFALSQRNDPVLSYAAELMGAKLNPHDAGKLNFLYRKKEAEDADTGDDEQPDSN